MTDIEPISDVRLADYRAKLTVADVFSWGVEVRLLRAIDARLRKAEAERDRYKAALDWADVARTWIRDGTCACCAACPFCGYDQVKSPGTHDRDCPLPKWDAARATLKEPTHG